MFRQVGRTSILPETLGGISALEFLHFYILLYHNTLPQKHSLKIICASVYLFSTRIFSGVGKLLSYMGISHYAQILIKSTSRMIPLFSVLFAISDAFYISDSYLSPSYYFKPDKFSIVP